MAGPGVLCCVVPGRREESAGLGPWGGSGIMDLGVRASPTHPYLLQGRLCTHPPNPRRVQASGRIWGAPPRNLERVLGVGPPPQKRTIWKLWLHGKTKAMAYGHRGAMEWGGNRGSGVGQNFPRRPGPPLPGASQRGIWAGPRTKRNRRPRPGQPLGRPRACLGSSPASPRVTPERERNFCTPRNPPPPPPNPPPQNVLCQFRSRF